MIVVKTCGLLSSISSLVNDIIGWISVWFSNSFFGHDYVGVFQTIEFPECL